MSQRICNLYENPILTVWAFLVLGRILRFYYLQFCLSTAELYQPSSQSIAEINYKASFSAKPFLSFFLSFSMEVKNPLSTSTEEMLLVTNQRYRCPACDKLELLKSANSVCTPFVCQPSWQSHFFVIQTGIRY